MARKNLKMFERADIRLALVQQLSAQKSGYKVNDFCEVSLRALVAEDGVIELRPNIPIDGTGQSPLYFSGDKKYMLKVIAEFLLEERHYYRKRFTFWRVDDYFIKVRDNFKVTWRHPL